MIWSSHEAALYGLHKLCAVKYSTLSMGKLKGSQHMCVCVCVCCKSVCSLNLGLYFTTKKVVHAHEITHYNVLYFILARHSYFG